MAKDSADAENFSRLLKAILPGELESLQAQDWQSTPLPGEAVYARFEKPAGITGLGGALPFLETHKGENPEGFTWTRSDNLARFLTENRSLCRSYLTLARADRLALHGAPGQAQLLRWQNGVGTVNLSANELLQLRVPLPPEGAQRDFAARYEPVAAAHHAAMQALGTGDTAGYQAARAHSEALLAALIADLEERLLGKSG